METNGSIGAAEASAALATVARSRAQVAWSGYPAWYWLVTGACLSSMAYTMLLPDWWDLPIAVAVWVFLAVMARVASRVRGIHEGCVRGAMTHRDVIALYGPATLIMLANAALSKIIPWVWIVSAIVIFLVFAGTGFTLGNRAARR